jgi:hypothetical protein
MDEVKCGVRVRFFLFTVVRYKVFIPLEDALVVNAAGFISPRVAFSTQNAGM